MVKACRLQTVCHTPMKEFHVYVCMYVFVCICIYLIYPIKLYFAIIYHFSILYKNCYQRTHALSILSPFTYPWLCLCCYIWQSIPPHSWRNSSKIRSVPHLLWSSSGISILFLWAPQRTFSSFIAFFTLCRNYFHVGFLSEFEFFKTCNLPYNT